MMTGAGLFRHIRALLSSANVPEPDAKARLLVAHGLGIEPGDVFLHKQADARAAERTELLARRCAGGEPLEYVTGVAYFRYLTLYVTPDVLIPRKETELVAEQAISLIRQNGYKNVLDLCTGSGCIAISLATETEAKVDACDISPAALDIARRNAARNGAQVRFILSDMFGAIKGAYDVIVSNPPYVSAEEYAALDEGVRLYEPRLALEAGDGLRFYRIIARNAGRHLRPGGALVLEIGASQAREISALLTAAGFGGISVNKDYCGRERIIAARKIYEERT